MDISKGGEMEGREVLESGESLWVVVTCTRHPISERTLFIWLSMNDELEYSLRYDAVRCEVNDDELDTA